ncbi:A disintegrin and metalloproteinase with thrombospondin motifs 18 [Echinops telfairi]|uniref:A disintegrin and metalloproteinase with thrombospondin motifs 18 n=1 Tax=Echinops telfairi TaxID=9371 RepID=A0AC55DDP1_ECHTE|nr:A disintegrin and metalloproteinase with thrombospondin motifs 18 [Echinops telfairi]
MSSRESHALAPAPGARTSREPLVANHRAVERRALSSSALGEPAGAAFARNYVFVTPVEVDEGGSYVSHDISHGSRRKRAALSARSRLHYRFSAFGQELHLELKPSAMLSSHFSVQVLGKDGASEDHVPTAAVRQCFYQGFIRDDSSSSVALSTCAGLSGLIRTGKREFLISPLPPLLAQEHNYSWPAGHHPHVLYKRTAEEKVQRYQGHPSSGRNGAGHPTSHISQAPQRQERDYHHRRSKRQHFCGRRKKYAPKPPTEDAYLHLEEYGRSGRPRRSAGKSQQGLTVETLVVADKKMVDRHGKGNVTTYILTVMNMVSSLFKDGTIGNDINIVVVSLILLEQEPAGLLINHHADQSLNSFCQWQSALVGKNGKRHDHAILLTGIDICSWKNEPCDTLGFAPISGMCSKARSCTINEDTGLGLAFTIAHESGHNLGMIHDGEGNPCRKAEGTIMSPTLMGNNGMFYWSACSRQYLKKFLRSFSWDICKSLWCYRVGQRCATKFMPAAEGTVCGSSMWCRRGQCVKFGEHGPRPVHGQWSSWSEWSQCSRTCGGGVRYQERHCSDPEPQYGGKFCPGANRIYQLCSIHPCPENSLDFRAQQCAEYNSKPFRGWFYQWEPYTRVKEEDRCKLYCKAENFEFFFAMSGKVKDGTPCSPHKNDVCIDGICEPVGCDHELGSKAVLDACGICKGDNSTCKFYKGLYLSQHNANEYHPVVTIPAGAQSIEIQELQLSSCYLAVRNLGQKYYLMGGWSIDWPGEFTFAGTTFEYQRPPNRPERLYAPGPTNETLVFEILMQGINPGVAWKYTLPKAANGTQTTPQRHVYSWNAVQSNCSVSCGGGYISIKAICLRDRKTQVSSSLCNARTKPATEPKICNAFACPAYWLPGEWSECSRSCAGGQQSRKMQCVQKKPFQKEEAVLHSFCPVSTPTQVQVCNPQACPPEWSLGPWSQCSKTCGRGVKKREVLCTSSATASPLPESLCTSLPKPECQEGCVLGRCPKNTRLQWVASAWSECSTTCGPGVRMRELKCSEKVVQGKMITFPERRCRHIKKPSLDLKETCDRGACPARPVYNLAAAWYTSPWQQCTVTCGGGVQTRAVHCVQQGRPSSGCLLHLKPPMLQACNTNFCPAPDKRGEHQLCVNFSEPSNAEMVKLYTFLNSKLMEQKLTAWEQVAIFSTVLSFTIRDLLAKQPMVRATEYVLWNHEWAVSIPVMIQEEDGSVTLPRDPH